MQIVFLPSILPASLRIFHIPDSQRLVTAGTIVFAYGASAAAGSYSLSRLARPFPPERLVLASALGASVFQVLLFAGAGPIPFTPIRMAQIAARSQGATIEIIHTARFAGNAAGPVIATFVLAHSDLLSLYMVLGAGLVAAALCHYLGVRCPSRIR